MSTDQEELRALVLSILGDPAPGLREGWQRLAASDLTLVSLPEADGGSGGSLVDAATILTATAEAGMSLPLVESTWQAGWLAAQAGRPVPAQIATLVVAGPELAIEAVDDRWVIRGRLTDLPWSTQADEVYVVSPEHAVVLVMPLGTLAVDTVVTADAWFPLRDTERQLAELGLRAALGRTAQIAGACRSALDLTLRYAGERVQFGRTLDKNQVIQHYLARVATQSYAVTRACDAALTDYDHRGMEAAASVRAAKAVASEAVEVVTTLTHQIVGAIGTTREHGLHLRTVALWEWRDDAGSEYEHGRLLAEEALAADGSDVWAFVAPEQVVAP